MSFWSDIHGRSSIDSQYPGYAKIEILPGPLLDALEPRRRDRVDRHLDLILTSLWLTEACFGERGL